MSFVGGELSHYRLIEIETRAAKKKRHRVAWHVKQHPNPVNAVDAKNRNEEGLVEIIDPNKPIVNVTGHNKAESQSKVKKGEFDAIFRQAVDSTEFKRPKTESAPLLSDIRPAQFSSESIPSENMLVERVQRLIDTMGAYKQKLIDSGASLKDIQSLVQKMATENESLRAASHAVEGQKRLKTIADQSMTLASMEIAKFNSGYYNDG